MKHRDLPENYDMLASWEELKMLIEALDNDVKKVVVKGSRRAGVRVRKGLFLARTMAHDIIHATFHHAPTKRMVDAEN